MITTTVQCEILPWPGHGHELPWCQAHRQTEAACFKAERDRLRVELRVACENLGKARAWLDLWRTGLPNASVKSLEEALGMDEEPAAASERGIFCLEHRKVMTDGVCPKCRAGG